MVISFFNSPIRNAVTKCDKIITRLIYVRKMKKWAEGKIKRNKDLHYLLLSHGFENIIFFKRHLAFMQSEQKRYAPCIWSNFVYASLLFDNVLVYWCCGTSEISLPSFSIKLSMRQICMHATTLLNIMILRSAFWNLRYFRIQCGGIQRMSHKRSPKTNELIAT